MHFAHKKYLVRFEEMQEDGVLHNQFGSISFLKGDKVAVNYYGNRFVVSKGQDEKYYVPVKIDKEVMSKGYEEMGDINIEEAEAGVHTLSDGLKES